ncbi:MAG: phosphoribosylamine--glycine ligase [Candidatus Zixiibacteriota bacterium]
MKILVIGGGGREHAIVWKLKQCRNIEKIFCAPGNPGIAQHATCVDLKLDNIKGLGDFAYRNKIGLTVVGPETPLAAGIVDEFTRRKMKIFGPDRKGAQLESSKVFAKQFMRKYNIPTAPFRVYSSYAEAMGFCKAIEYPAVIKADGLAAGKGAVVVRSLAEAEATIDQFMVKRTLGIAGSKIVIESFLPGLEVSLMAITDGKVVLPLLPSQDHKQLFDGDRGPNTGGMGAYCPTPFTSQELLDDIHEHVLLPTLKGLQQEGINYKGVIYAGLMLTSYGPKVLEFNCRFGDPETQAVLPLLKTDFLEVLQATVNQKLSGIQRLEWKPGASACVVMASKGYPGKYNTGVQINGLANQYENGCHVFHAGTANRGGKLVTNGGRVLGVMASDKDLPAAINRAYKLVQRIRFDGATFRKDIGAKAREAVPALVESSVSSIMLPPIAPKVDTLAPPIEDSSGDHLEDR